MRENVQYIGEVCCDTRATTNSSDSVLQFHLVRHSEVRKERVFREERSSDGALSVVYSRARVRGEILAVRYYEERAESVVTAEGGAAEAALSWTAVELRDRISAHEELLQTLS